jgi:hypothetical protein
MKFSCVWKDFDLITALSYKTGWYPLNKKKTQENQSLETRAELRTFCVKSRILLSKTSTFRFEM